MDSDAALDLEQGRSIDQGLRLRVDGVSGVSVRDGRNGLHLLLLLGLDFGVVEFDVSL